VLSVLSLSSSVIMIPGTVLRCDNNDNDIVAAVIARCAERLRDSDELHRELGSGNVFAGFTDAIDWCGKRHSFLSALSLCLPRACLGKMIVFHLNGAKRRVSHRLRSPD
jgi:hypothetical protein